MPYPYAQLGRRIVEARQHKNISAAQFAHQTNIPIDELIRIEGGAVRPTAERLAAMAQCLAVPLSYLFDGIDDPP
jgi:transcriptional regulator with XRE-family HTH domain